MGSIAQEGNAVIVGRGAPFFLRERSDTFRVFTYAPHEEKIRRLLATGKPRAEAEDLVKTSIGSVLPLSSITSMPIGRRGVFIT